MQVGHNPSRMRVGFVLHVMQVAGAEVLVAETIRALRGKIDATVFCLDAIGPLGKQLRAEGIEVISFGRRPGVDLGVAARMAREVRRRRIQVLHAHQYTPFFYAALARVLSGNGCRVMFTEHGRHFPDLVSPTRRWLNQRVLGHLADEVNAVCAFSARSLSESDGFSGRSIEIIENGIALDRYEYAEDRDALRHRLGLSDGRRYVVNVARFHPVKDQATLLRAFREVADAHDDTDLLLVGDGPQRENLETLTASLGLSERVRFLGVREDVPAILRAADVFALTSKSEAASITLLEAMASSLPIVATAVGGTPELVRDGVEGLLAPRGDACGIARAILCLLRDPAKAEAMGRAGAARAHQQFRLEQTIDRYLAGYVRLTMPAPATRALAKPKPALHDLNLLAVTSELPWPLDTGGHIRTFHLLSALAKKFKVRLVVGITEPEPAGIAHLREAGIDVRAVFIGKRLAAREMLRAAGAALTRQPYVFFRRHAHSAVRRMIKDELTRNPPDLLYLDHLDGFVFADEARNIPAMIDMHNVYSVLAARTSAEARNLGLRSYLRREAQLLAQAERRAARGTRAVLAVSPADGAHFSSLGAQSVHVIPNGVDCAAYDGVRPDRAQGPVIVYVGSLRWSPNAAAAEFLAASVLPQIRRQYPDAQLRLIGEADEYMARALTQFPGVNVLGRVPDVRPHLRDADLLAVPLESGGGSRLKILEAFAAGVPVVSTPTGCEGLPVEHGQHLIVAERQRFADAVTTLLANPQTGKALAANARRLVQEGYDWSAVGVLACDAVAMTMAASE